MNFVKYQSPHNNNIIWHGYVGEKIYDGWYAFVRLKINNEICSIENTAIDIGYAEDICDEDLIRELDKLVVFS